MNKDIADRFEDLINEGKSLISKSYRSYNSDYVENSRFLGWKAGCISAMESLPKEAHPYKLIFEKEVTIHSKSEAEVGVGILQSLLGDIQKGYLKGLETLIISNTYTGLLEVASEYLTENHKDPAGVLAGVALEDTIRRMGQKYLIDYKDTFKFGTINQKLSKALPYNDAKRNEIDSWYKVRDLAIHAKWDEFDEGQVKGMIECTKNLIADYL